MPNLSIYLDYSKSLYALFGNIQTHELALPVKITDSEGTILHEGLASSTRPLQLKIKTQYSSVFVRLTWPSGFTETQQANFGEEATVNIIFSDRKVIRDDWSAWAIPRLNVRSTRGELNKQSNNNIGKYDNTWLQLWQFDNSSSWHPSENQPLMQYRSDTSRQIDLKLDKKPYLLQVGASNVPWRFVSLPSGGPCRVLITANNILPSNQSPLKITITSFRSNAETLLEFLARDAVNDAKCMANSNEIAVELLREKFEDPIAAVAGAYYLLRIEDWERVPLLWWKNLSARFVWIPDTAIVHCIRILRSGLKNREQQLEAINLFKACLDRGWPVYEEGIKLLQEASSLLKQIANQNDVEYFTQVEALSTAKVWAGSALSFYGREPSKPSAVHWVGMPYARRRHKLPKTDWLGKMATNNLKEVAESAEQDVSIISRNISSLEFARELAPQKFINAMKGDLPLAREILTASNRSEISKQIAFLEVLDTVPDDRLVYKGNDENAITYAHSGTEVAKSKLTEKRATLKDKYKETFWLTLGDIGDK